jgi:hypothetical protein
MTAHCRRCPPSTVAAKPIERRTAAVLRAASEDGGIQNFQPGVPVLGAVPHFLRLLGRSASGASAVREPYAASGLSADARNPL